MNAITIFLLNFEKKLKKIIAESESPLETKGKKAHGKPDVFLVKDQYDATKTTYDALERSLENERMYAPEPTRGQIVESFVKNPRNIVRNAWDKVFGKPIAWAQKKRTEHRVKNDKGKNVVYLMAGVEQGPENQTGYARQLRRAGFEPYHIKPHNELSREEAVEEAFKEIGHFQKKVGQGSKELKQYASGHSSGADKWIYASGDPRFKSYGIRAVQAIAPAPYGIRARTIEQKAIMHIAPEDDIERSEQARRNALEMAKREPGAPIFVISGLRDRLVDPRNAYYRKAKRHDVIDHPHATHFGTSGSNKEINRDYLVEHMKQILHGDRDKKEKYREREYREAA